MNRRGILALLLATIMLLAPMSVFAEGIWTPIEDEGSEESFFFNELNGDKLLEQLRGKFELRGSNFAAWVKEMQENAEDGRMVFIVDLSEPSGLEIANRRGVSYEDMQDAADLEREALLSQESVLSELEARGVAFKVVEQYTAVLNAVAIEVEVEDLDKMEGLQGVEAIYHSNTFYAPKTELKTRMYTSHEMISDEEAWKMGYKGEGSVVAVLDTGIDFQHKDFATLTDDSKAKLNDAKVYDIISQNNLKGRFFSKKVPYGYNYFDKNQDVKDSAPGASMHGMHVSGTVAANGEIKGVAPESQVLAMKVFGNDPLFATTSDHIYVKAFDDAIKLGADVINMSLGSPAGFNVPTSVTSKAITNAVENGIVFAISAGNEGTSIGDDQDVPFDKENPDISMLGSPSVFKDSTSVASVQNQYTLSEGLVVGDYKFGYMSSEGPDPTELTGEYEYLDCKLGRLSPTENDFSGLDLKGKVALIQRGDITFTDKINNAASQGAVAAIIYNNRAGEFGMSVSDIKIPAVSITQDSGKTMLQQIPAGKNKVRFPKEKQKFPRAGGNLMSGFSSWGPTPTLELKPEISAPGGNIYSTMNDDKYAFMSGTSMAAPHVAGGFALIRQYIREKLPEFKYNSITPNTNFGMTEIPNGSYVIGAKAFDQGILMNPEKSKLLYDALKTAEALYKINNKYYNNKGEVVEYNMPAEVTYYDANGNEYKVRAKWESNATKSNEPLTKGETTRLAKVLMMNTATLMKDKDENIVSPRKQGAGIMNIKAAISTPAVLLDSTTNEPKVELKNLPGTKFDLNLRVVNASNKPLTYQVETITLRDLIDENGKSRAFSEKLDAKVTGEKEISVEPNGFTDFTVSVDFENEDIYRNMFVEGFVQLNSRSAETLSIPFMGFYGDYSEPEMFFPWSMLGEGETARLIGNPYNYGSWIEANERIVWAKDYVAQVTPNKSILVEKKLIPSFEDLQMFYGFRRNAGEVEYRLYDMDGKDLGLLQGDRNVRKSYMRRPFTIGPKFNGTYNGYPLQDGKYMYEVRAKSPMEGAKWQSKKVPVVVDGTGPIIEATLKGNTLLLNVTDETTTVLGGMVAGYNGESEEFLVIERDAEGNPILKDGKEIVKTDEFGRPTGEKTLELKVDANKFMKNGEFGATLMFFDQMGNIRWSSIKRGEEKTQPNIYFLSPEAFDTYNSKSGAVQVQFAVFDTKFQPKAYLNGEEVTDVVFNRRTIIPGPFLPTRLGPAFIFTKVIELKDLEQGYNDLKVTVKTVDGLFERGLVRTVFVDTEAPMLQLDSMGLTDDGKLRVHVNAEDKTSPWATLYVNGRQVHYFDHSTFDDELKGFKDSCEVTVDVVPGENVFEFKLVDDFGNEVIEVLKYNKAK